MSDLLNIDRFRRYAASVVDYIDRDAPSPILARQVMLLFRAAWVTCGEDMNAAFGEWMRTHTRMESGLCQMCDTEIFPPQHPKLCEQHDAEAETMSRDLGGRCPACGSHQWVGDGDWDDDGNQTAEYMSCRDCGHSGPMGT